MRAGMLAALVLFFANDVFGRANLDFSIHQQFISPRAMGNGGTFSGIDDYNVLFMNPAGLARLEEGEINLGVQAGATLDPSILDLISDVESSDGDTEKIADILVDNQGNTYTLRGPTLNLIWARPGWGIGLIPLDVSLNLGIQQFAMGVKAINDTTLAFGYAHHFGKKSKDLGLSVGGTVRANYRAAGDVNYTAFDLAADSELIRPDDLDEALFLDADLGVMWTPMVPTSGWLNFLKYAKPTFSLVVRNILDDAGNVGNMNFLSEESGDDPESPQTRYDLGSRWDLPNWWLFTPRILADIRDMNHRYWTFVKGSHLGAELGWRVGDWLNGAWRVGLNQGYWTAGVTAHALWFRADLVSYGEELGTTDAPQENRIYMAKLSLHF